MTADFKIERLKLTDVEDLSEFAVGSFIATFGHLYKTEDLGVFLVEWNTLHQLETQLADPAYAIALIRVRGGIIGFAKLGPIDFTLPHDQPTDRAIELHQLYLSKEAKGTGVADALMAWAIGEARARGNIILYLSVFTENPRAQGFYRRYGFYDVGCNPFRVGNHIDEDRIWRLDL